MKHSSSVYSLWTETDVHIYICMFNEKYWNTQKQITKVVVGCRIFDVEILAQNRKEERTSDESNEWWHKKKIN